MVAFGKTPDVPKDGVQVAVDSGGVALNSESHGSKVTVQATTDMGVKFSTNIGPVSFSAGIDPNQWQVGLSFGPEVTQLSSLAGIMSNAQSAVATGARNLVAGTSTSRRRGLANRTSWGEQPARCTGTSCRQAPIARSRRLAASSK